MDKVTRRIVLSGIRPILFDRYPGDNAEKLSVLDKLYLVDGKLVLPAVNISSFLSSQNTESATQRVMGKSWKATAKAALSFVDIDPVNVPFTREGKELTVENAGIEVVYHTARVKKGQLAVPNPKERPVLDVPWELTFTLTLFKNPTLSEGTLRRIFEEGGLAVGLGTYRGVYGKFVVQTWE